MGSKKFWGPKDIEVKKMWCKKIGAEKIYGSQKFEVKQILGS